MYLLNNVERVLLEKDDICYECRRYEDCECIQCIHLKNIARELDARISIYSCNNYCGPEEEEEIDF